MSITSVGTQAGGVTVDTATSASRAFGASVASGNRVVVVAMKGIATHRAFIAGDCTKSAGTATIGSITLDKTAAFDATGQAAAVWVDVGIWSAAVTGSGTLTMQVAGDAGTFWVLATDEFHGSVGAISVDTHTASASGASGAPDSGTVTPTSFPAVLVGGVASASTGPDTHTPDAAFTQMYEEENGISHMTGSAIYEIMAAGSDSASWTAPTLVGWAAVAVSYVEAGGGGGATVAMEWKQPFTQPTSHYNTSIIMAQSQTPPVVPWLVTKATFVTNTFDWILPTVDLDWTVG